MAKSVFKKVDLTRAIEAARAGGLAVGRIEIDPVTGRIVIVTASEGSGNEDALDNWLKKHAR